MGPLAFLATPGGGALASAGMSLIGGLLGKKDKVQRQEVDFTKLRDNAQAAGFNPLTALRATGGQGFGVNTMPGLSSAEVLGNAVQAGLGTYLSHDPIAEETRRLENDLLRQEIERGKKTGFPVRGVSVSSSPVETRPTLADINPRQTVTTPTTPTMPRDPAVQQVLTQATQLEPEPVRVGTGWKVVTDGTNAATVPDFDDVDEGFKWGFDQMALRNQNFKRVLSTGTKKEQQSLARRVGAWALNPVTSAAQWYWSN